MDARLELGDTFRADKFPDLKVDYVLANPPFNDSDYYRAEKDERWRYGVPPAGNANYAWLQHFISKLAPNGTAGIVLSNGSMSSDIATEGDIRRALIEADLVDCMVALPAQLFYNTQIPACLWFLARNKTDGKLRNRSHEILFIDARELGTRISRRQKTMPDEDIARIADAYHNWRSREKFEQYANTAGFCKAVNIQEIRKNSYILTPGRYIDFEAAEEDGEIFEERMRRLTADLQEQMAKAATLDQKIKENLAKVGFEL